MFSTLRTCFGKAKVRRGLRGAKGATGLAGAPGSRGLIFLAALAAALLLVPVANALAANGSFTANPQGEGSGEVTSDPEFGGVTDPLIACQWNGETETQSGTCSGEKQEDFVSFVARPAQGTELVGFFIEEGGGSFLLCEGESGTEIEPGVFLCAYETDATVNSTVAALFEPCAPGSTASTCTAGPTEFPLTLTTNTGTGTGTVKCDTGSGPGACAAEYPEGTEVEVIPTEDVGSEFVEWTGDCTSNGPCEVTMNGAHSVNAVFNLEPPGPEFPLNLSTSGSGSGSFECDTGSGAGPCAAEYPEGTIVTVIHKAAVGSVFVKWTGDCSGSGACSVTMGAEHSVGAEFNLASTSPLTVFVTGPGSVSANSGTISGCTEAGGSACEGEYEGPVTLTATPASGSTFAGWIGCKHATATTCTIDVTAASEVTAVFLVEGPPGTDGKNIVVGTATAGECPTGGITVEIEGEPLTKQHICNGAQGLQGNPGTPGTNGKNIVVTAGAPGCGALGGVTVEVQGEPLTKKEICNGATGAAGSNGTNGTNGKDGPQGPQGAQGPQGPAGKVTCKVKNTSKTKVKVTCTVKTGASASSAARLGWRLMRAGHAVSHGDTSAARLQRLLNHLRAGRYVLRLSGQQGGQQILVS